VIKLFKSFKEYTDTGFSAVPEGQPERLLNQDGSLNVKRTGLGYFTHLSVFRELIEMKWWKFNLIVIASYLIINVFFALIYLWIGVEGLNVRNTDNETNDFLNAFYFSAQTFSTVGYGRENPVNHTANLVAVFEMLIGMMYLALAAGLLYGRFSRPVSKIIFSENALISPYKGGKGFMFRLSNAKNNLLIEVEVQVLLSMKVQDNDKEVRKFYQLELERTKINMLALSWTVVHPIDGKSPIENFTELDLKEADPEYLVFVTAINDTNSQLIHARTSYKYQDIVWGAKFSTIFEERGKKTIVNIDRINEFKPAELFDK
jgi:inward rectifier potassium channel